MNPNNCRKHIILCSGSQHDSFDGLNSLSAKSVLAGEKLVAT
jgi:hypothetical protein